MTIIWILCRRIDCWKADIDFDDCNIDSCQTNIDYDQGILF